MLFAQYMVLDLLFYHHLSSSLEFLIKELGFSLSIGVDDAFCKKLLFNVVQYAKAFLSFFGFFIGDAFYHVGTADVADDYVEV